MTRSGRRREPDHGFHQDRCRSSPDRPGGYRLRFGGYFLSLSSDFGSCRPLLLPQMAPKMGDLAGLLGMASGE